MKEVGAWILECKPGMLNVNLPGQRMLRPGLELIIEIRGVVRLTAMAKEGPCNVSLSKGKQLRMVRIKIGRRMLHHRIGCKPNPTSSVKAAHRYVINVGIGCTSTIIALVPRITQSRDE